MCTPAHSLLGAVQLKASIDRIAYTRRHLHHEMWMFIGVEFDL